MPLFRSRKELQRLDTLEAQEVEIQKIKERAQKKAVAQTEAFAKFNGLVDTYGASGVVYVLMGGRQR